MILSVWVAEWVLDEDRRTLRVDDPFRSWLTFTDADRPGHGPPERRQTIQGIAQSLPPWPGVEDGRHPVAITVGGATLYWDAPRPVDGAIEVSGSVSSNNVDAPDGFPDAHGVIRRVRMEWQPVDASGTGRPSAPGTDARARYEDVQVSYLPGHDVDPNLPRALRWTGCLIDLDLAAAPA